MPWGVLCWTLSYVLSRDFEDKFHGLISPELMNVACNAIKISTVLNKCMEDPKQNMAQLQEDILNQNRHNSTQKSFSGEIISLIDRIIFPRKANIYISELGICYIRSKAIAASELIIFFPRFSICLMILGMLRANWSKIWPKLSVQVQSEDILPNYTDICVCVCIGWF